MPRLLPNPGRTTTRSISIIVFAWVVLQVGGLVSPGLLDDVDSIYIEVAREMLHRRDFVTPYIDGIRFFDKPPLMYWLAAGSMSIFGEHAWAARLPLALAVLALLISVYALGLRLYQDVAESGPQDSAALYAALALGTSFGPYLYTRFFIPDILLCLWMTLGVHSFLIAIDRASLALRASSDPPPNSQKNYRRIFPWSVRDKCSPLLPSLLFAAILALNLLTKGLIGLVFPLSFVLIYTFVTKQWRLLQKLPLLAGSFVFLAVALPWHVLAALRNPAIPMPSGTGLPVRAGWTWFYLYNEHFARFFGRRIPHDYGQTPVWLFWLYSILWMMPWAMFLPAAVARAYRHLHQSVGISVREREAALTVTLWSLVVLIFFSLSTRQEYYSLPALPALALMVGGLLAEADRPGNSRAAAAALACHRWLLLPISLLISSVCAFLALTTPQPAPGANLAQLLNSNPELYNLSLGHLFDLTTAAMSMFRGPLMTVSAGMLVLGLGAYLLRRSGRSFAANLAVAAGAIVVLLAVHESLVRFNPILGSESLAREILRVQQVSPLRGDCIVLDGELTSGSSLLFYTRQPVHLVNGRVNGPWFGSFWPDAPPIFESEATLRVLWSSSRRVFLLTYRPMTRQQDLFPFGPVHTLASAGGKSVLINR